jgi:ribosomal protein L32
MLRRCAQAVAARIALSGAGGGAARRVGADARIMPRAPRSLSGSLLRADPASMAATPISSAVLDRGPAASARHQCTPRCAHPGADASGVTAGALSDAVLSDAVLSGAVLSGAVLSGAVLSGAVLSGAVSGALSSGGDLSGIFSGPAMQLELELCAVPKSRITPSQRGQRRHAGRLRRGLLTNGHVVKCTSCGFRKLAGVACGMCGIHHGRFFREALSAAGRRRVRAMYRDGAPATEGGAAQ